MNEFQELKLIDLHERHPGLTPALGNAFLEAACVCWSRHHQSPVIVSVNNQDKDVLRIINFPDPDERTRNAHANEIDATEAGAYATSLAAVEDLLGLVAVSRAETLTGADWYVAPIGTMIEDLEGCIRLEVSGVSGGSNTEVKKRLREKVAQAERGKSNLPAIASVVGFKALQIAICPVRHTDELG